MTKGENNATRKLDLDDRRDTSDNRLGHLDLLRLAKTGAAVVLAAVLFTLSFVIAAPPDFCEKRADHPKCAVISTSTSVLATTTSSTTTTTAAPGDLTPSGPIIVNGSNVVIENVHFTGSGNCVRVENATNVTIRNSRFTNCHKGVYAINSVNVVVVGNTFEADRSDRGRNAVQFDKVNLGRIADNTITASGTTLAEDHVSLYKSNGTASNPILVEGNHMTGGGPSNSGSGIMLGDNGGSHQIARNNILTNPGQVGIGVASGTNIEVSHNEVSSSRFAWSNVGIYVWNQSATACHSITVASNTVDWLNRDGNPNPFWNGRNCDSVNVEANSWQ